MIQTPDRKVTVGLFAGALMSILAWISAEFFNVVIPADVALAGSTIIIFMTQYAIPNKETPSA